MQLISESVVQNILNAYEDTNVFANDFQLLADEQPLILGFISKEHTELLTEYENAILEFLSLVIYQSVKKASGKIPELNQETLEEQDELSWTEWSSHISKNIKTAFDHLFEITHQEDLLALVEDTLQQDDDHDISSVGREIIAVSCFSLIEALHKCN
jgi:hypothetical protein